MKRNTFAVGLTWF